MKLLPGNRRQFSRLPVLCAGALVLSIVTSGLRAQTGTDDLPADAHEVLASNFLSHGQFMEAEAELRMALAHYPTFGPLIPRRVEVCREKLAQALIAQREFARAEAEYQTILAIRQQHGPKDQRKTLFYEAKVAALLLLRGQDDELRALVSFLYPEAQRLLAPNDTTRLSIELLQKAAAWKEPAEPDF